MAWKVNSLGEICDLGGGEIKTGPFGSQLHQHDYRDEGTPVVMPKNILEGKVSEAGIARIGEEDLERLCRHKLLPGDIVYGRRGDIGRHAFVTNREAGWLCGTGCLRINLGENGPLAPHFLHYYLEWDRMIDWIKNHAIGATMPNLNTSILRQVPIEYPILQVQNRITSILSTYDDLIENNSRRIHILEEMAQRIYTEWFVHFRFPGYEKVKMVDSDLGKIPSEWRAGTLSDACTVLPGYAFKSKDWSETGIPVIKIKNIRPGRVVDIDEVDHVPTELFSSKFTKFQLNNEDYLIAMTGATAGKVGKLRTATPMLLNQRVAKLIPQTGYADYLWCRISSEEAEKEFYRLADGAAQPNMSGSQIESVGMLIPEPKVLRLFAETVSPMIQQVDTLMFKNRNLRQTRDLLLPKLISGEIDVSEMSHPQEVIEAA